MRKGFGGLYGLVKEHLERDPLSGDLYLFVSGNRTPALLPQSSLGKAIEYMLSLWPGLTVFLSDPRVPLDNNAAERALRGVVVGRKNHCGSHSKRGVEVAALFYTMFESAKLAGVDPHAYTLEAARRGIASPGTVTLPEELT